MVKPKYKPLGKPAKRLNTVRTRSTRGSKTVTVEVAAEIDNGGVIPTLHQDVLQAVTPDLDINSIAAPTEGTSSEASNTPKVSKHHEKRILAADKWAALRPGLIQCLIMDSYPATFTCCACNCTPANCQILRCTDCGPGSYFCEKCCVKQHQTSLHSIQMWSQEDGFFREYWLPTVWKRLDGHLCLNTYAALIVVINDRGHQRLQKMEFCSCQDRALTLLGYGLWPASPDIPTIAFTMELMLTLRALILEGQLPLTAFCHGMQQHRVNMKPTDWVADIARVVRWEVVLNFMEVYHHTKFLQYESNIYNPLECLACPKENSERGKIICMDGNFRLVHRKAAGGPPLDVRHNPGFFSPQPEVDAFVSAHTAKRKSHNKTCNNFQADSVIRTKNKTEKLDVTGVFGAVCNHDFPQKFFNLRFGERMGYPVYLMSNIKNIEILLYDIGCQLEAHLLKNNITCACQIGIGAFHIYGHVQSCKLKYSPRILDGAGLCDGEGAERCWSYLGRFASISKEMTSENRSDILNEALLHYGNRITQRLGTTLCQRLEKAYMLKDSTDNELQKLMSEHQGITHTTIGMWSASERVEKRKKTAEQDEWKVDYALTLFEFYEEMKSVQATQTAESDDGNIETESEEMERLETQLLRKEKRHKFERWSSDSDEYNQNLQFACDTKRKDRLEEVWDQAVEYKHTEQLRHKYSKGSSLAHRISVQIQKASKKLNDSIKKYNAVPLHGSETIPHRIERGDVSLESPIWLHIDTTQTEGPFLAGTEKRKCIDSFRLNKRAKEEIKRTLGDMIVLLENLEERLLLIQQVLEKNCAIQEPSRLDLAITAVMRKHLLSTQAEFEQISNIFSRSSRPHITDMVTFIELIGENLAQRILPTEREGLSAAAINDVLSDVEKIEEQHNIHEDNSDSFDDCDQ